MGLKSEIINIHKFLSQAGIDHALIGGFALAVHGINRATGDIDLLLDAEDLIGLKIQGLKMTFFEYLDFLDDYWDIFGPPPIKERVEYTNVKF